jgi:hypothetical protein
MFVGEFEKTAAKGKSEVLQALKGIGKSALEAGKGVAEGVHFHAKRSADKFKKEMPELKKSWKGLKHPESYKAIASAGVKFAPEAAIGYVGAKGLKYAFDPNARADAPLAYY